MRRNEEVPGVGLCRRMDVGVGPLFVVTLTTVVFTYGLELPLRTCSRPHFF